MRTIKDLNFGWKYSDSFSDKMLLKNFYDKELQTVDLPHTNKELPYNYFDEKSYQFISCYRKHFRLNDFSKSDGKRVLLHFEGAANYSIVYVNGKKAGEHKGGYTPFAFDITDLISTRDNVIAVCLDSTERNDIPPFGNVIDYLCYGGIYREVWLEIVDNIYIENLFIKTPEVLSNKKLMDIDVTFSQKTSGLLSLELWDNEKQIASKSCQFDAKKLNIKWRVENVKLWDIDNPNLYTLRVIYNKDEKCEFFGFRTAKFTKQGFFLNGKHIKLIGLNRHQSYPYVGYAMPKSAQEADADLVKFELGCNFVRTSHYPNSIHFLNRCDEIGLLVFTEMPGWQHIGEGEWRKNAVDDVHRMVIRDRNHPSVILWGVRINEGPDCDELYKSTNSVAHKNDPTRQTGGVRNFPRSHLLEDVYTYNDFSHSGSFVKLLPPSIVCGLKSPYLVTEFNGHMFPTKSFDRESLRTEHALRHARVQSASHSNNRISGAVGWCMSDYNTHKDFGSGDRICYHGVTDMFRLPKPAASLYASQQEKTPILECSSSMDIGDHPGGIIGQVYLFTNCDYVKVYKNGHYTSTAYPNYKKFPGLKHPPICPDDYLGDILTEVEKLPEECARYLKDALVAAGKHGYIMPPQNYAKVAIAMAKGKISFSRLVDLITKYFANWGDEQTSYRFDGYSNGELVKSIVKTAVKGLNIRIKADATTLVENETYDVTRISLIATDQNENRLYYANNNIKVEINGPAEIIGPSEFALLGGARAFWVRTIGESGDITINITGENFAAQSLSLTSVKV